MIYDNNKQLYTVMGGKSQNLSTDFEVRKAILELLGGDADSCASIYDIDLQILKIYEAGGGNIPEGGECPETPLAPITITENGTYTPEEGGYNEVVVNVAGSGGVKVKVSSIEFNNSCVDENGTINANQIDTSLITSMSSMFNYCKALQSVGDLSGWNTSNVTSMYGMFNNCNSLQSVGDLSGWDTSNVTNISNMFSSCEALQSVGDLSGWNTSNVTSMYGMFNGCKSLQSVGDLSGWDTSNVTTIRSMFNGCKALQSVGDLSGWDTSKVTEMNYLFAVCKLLTQLDLSGWDTSNVTSISNMFNNSNNITNLVGGKTYEQVVEDNIGILNGIKINLPKSSSVYDNSFLPANIDRATIRALFNGLADLTGQSSQNIELSDTQIAMLTDEDIAVATAKNWTIS